MASPSGAASVSGKRGDLKNLTFSGEVMYTNLDQKYSGAIATPVIGTKPAAVYEFKDQNTVSFAVRAQRNW